MSESPKSSPPIAKPAVSAPSKKGRRSPLVIAIGVHAIVLLVAAIWVWQIPATPENRVDFLPRGKDKGSNGGGSPVRTLVRQKIHSSPPKDARIAAAGAISAIVLPPPSERTDLSTLPALGSSSLQGGLSGSGGRGNGSGTGTGNGFGSGSGMGGGGTGGLRGVGVRFFDQEVKVKRIAYVIDFSKSMKGRRQELMRTELAKSIGMLTPLQSYQLIFFAGPVWVAGSTVNMAEDQKSAVVVADGGAEHKWTAINVGNWEMSGRRQEAKWLVAEPTAIRRSVSTIHNTELVYGTYWKPAIELALSMQPAPEVIYFMTDGIVSKKVYETIEELGRTARRRGTVINTISMMEPEAADAMRALAKESKGTFTMVHADGSSTVSNTKD